MVRGGRGRGRGRGDGIGGLRNELFGLLEPLCVLGRAVLGVFCSTKGVPNMDTIY